MVAIINQTGLSVFYPKMYPQILQYISQKEEMNHYFKNFSHPANPFRKKYNRAKAIARRLLLDSANLKISKPLDHFWILSSKKNKVTQK